MGTPPLCFIVRRGQEKGVEKGAVRIKWDMETRVSGPLVAFEKVSLLYQAPQGETEALKDVSFSVREGEFVAIVGPSGCGKTTMLSLMMGLMTPTSGAVRYPAGKRPMGYMLQRDHLLEWRTVEKNVLLGLEVRHLLTAESRQKALELLKTYGLGEFAKFKPSQLSGGMRQKAALIRTLALEPEVLLLDEPFSALDYQTRLTLGDEVRTIIKKERKTAVLVTHDIGEAVSMADRVLVFSGRPAMLREEVPLPFPEEMTPLQRREAPLFQPCFKRIWASLTET